MQKVNFTQYVQNQERKPIWLECEHNNQVIGFHIVKMSALDWTNLLDDKSLADAIHRGSDIETEKAGPVAQLALASPLIKFYAAKLTYCLCDETGKRLYQKPDDLLEAVTDTGLIVAMGAELDNAMPIMSTEDAEKNSTGRPGSDS